MSRHCGLCRQNGHTRRTCKQKEGESIIVNTIAGDNSLTRIGCTVDGFSHAVGDLVSVKYPWLDYDIEARIDSISSTTGNVWLYDTIRQYYRGYNFISGARRGIELKPLKKLSSGKRKRKKDKTESYVDLDNDFERAINDISNSSIFGD